MKKLKLLSYLMLVASSLLFFQCTHDKEYVVGPAGADGIDGIDGVDGVDFSADCRACHSNEHREPIEDAYALSGHANGTSWARGTRTSCARCHNNEGFIDYLSGNFVDDDGFQSANPDGYLVSNAINCTGCHTDHRSFDFENDGNDYALRTLDPVELIIDPTVFIDIRNDSDLLGKSNTCVACHQPRRTGPTDDGLGTFAVTSTHWGPHYGAQSTMLEGIEGALIPGTMGYPGIASATHRTGSSCVNCHMGETTDTSDGSHTLWPTENACITCHTNGAPSEVTGLAADLITLEGLLENVVGWEYQYEVDINGDLIEDINGDPIIVLDINGDPVTLEVHGILHDGHPNTGTYGEGATFNITEAKAAWNYLFVNADGSNGVHNPDYAKALINNSIEALD